MSVPVLKDEESVPFAIDLFSSSLEFELINPNQKA